MLLSVEITLTIKAFAECKMTLDYKPTRKELTAAARFANAVPWRLAHRDNLVAKVSGPVTGGRTPPTLSAHTSGPLGVIGLKYLIVDINNGNLRNLAT